MTTMPWPALVVAIVMAFTAMVAGCGGDDDASPPAGAPVTDAGLQHVHGLGVNPADGALYIATHSGLWRAPDGEKQAARVGDVRHDLMGFTVTGPDTFLASGHPDGRHDLPPQLGLQRSTDAGRSWQTVSLLGEADLHVLRAAGRRIYGVDSGTGGLLTSADAGRSWQPRTAPGAVFDLAMNPSDARRLVAATETGLRVSADTGRTWRPLDDERAGLLAWPATRELYLVEGDGTVSRSTDGGRSFDRTGDLGGQPEAFAADDDGALYAALHGGVIRTSGDGGATWRLRAGP